MFDSTRIRQRKRLSPEGLRQYEGFENIGDEDAEAVIESLEKFSTIMFHLLQKIKANEIDSKYPAFKKAA